MKPKRVYFFKGARYLRYDARTDHVDLTTYPSDVSPAWRGLAEVAQGADFDAILNWGDGFVYFFRNDIFVRYDVRADTATGPPSTIAAGLPALAGVGFDRDLSAAVHYRPGKALLFKGDRYLRYDLLSNTVDAEYPKLISAGWAGIDAAGFSNGIDAAVNFGEGKAYFFKGPSYVRVDIASNAVDPGFPLDIASQWPALPPEFTADLFDIVEWPYCDVAEFDVQIDPNCVSTPGKLTFPPSPSRVHRLFAVVGRFEASAYPADCRCGEYRQFVRGTYSRNSQLQKQPLGNPQGGPPLTLLPRPAQGAAFDNFQEDSLQRSGSLTNLRYGHRDELPGNVDLSDRYLPDRPTGCEYRGFDAPFLEGQAGETYSFDLDFRGVLVDVCNGNEEMVRKEWGLFCSGTF